MVDGDSAKSLRKTEALLAELSTKLIAAPLMLFEQRLEGGQQAAFVRAELSRTLHIGDQLSLPRDMVLADHDLPFDFFKLLHDPLPLHDHHNGSALDPVRGAFLMITAEPRVGASLTKEQKGNKLKSPIDE
jgi:hypothetical protein